MLVREPVVAGRFYPGTREPCLREIRGLAPALPPADVPAHPVAGIVPHAGWMFSGATALAVLEAIRSRRSPKTFVIFGAVHDPRVRRNALFPHGAWETPLGLVEVDERLAGEILAIAGDVVSDDPEAHENEHSIEVQLPLIHHVFPEARVVPIAAPPTAKAVPLGRAVAQAIRNAGADAVCLGSTDLTHYGPMYGFMPHGTGAAGLRWMRNENDRRMLDLMERMDAEGAVAEAEARSNACGSGAVAATLAAARELGAARGVIVEYTTSADVMRQRMGREETDAAVGYAGVVF
jgi:hypothetical protein